MALRPSLRALSASALVGGAVLGWICAPDMRTPDPFGPGVHAQEPAERNFSVTAHKYGFAPAILEVNQDDLVRITFSTDDIPHSFTLDKYRIAKRVERGKPVVFEFRADEPGRFPIYCNLAIDEKCREMKGELVVNRK